MCFLRLYPVYTNESKNTLSFMSVLPLYLKSLFVVVGLLDDVTLLDVLWGLDDFVSEEVDELLALETDEIAELSSVSSDEVTESTETVRDSSSLSSDSILSELLDCKSSEEIFSLFELNFSVLLSFKEETITTDVKIQKTRKIDTDETRILCFLKVTRHLLKK